MSSYKNPNGYKSAINQDAIEIEIYSFSANESFNFPAFLTDFNDQRTANWSSQEIYGRMDPIYTYKNTIRKISVGFDVVSNNFAAKTKFSKIKDLQKSLYPVYSERPGELGAANISSPPLFRLKIGNILYSEQNNTLGILGWIDNFNLKLEFENGFIVEQNENGDAHFYPKLLKINFNFNVIHETPLGFTVKDGLHYGRHDRVPEKNINNPIKPPANPFQGRDVKLTDSEVTIKTQAEQIAERSRQDQVTAQTLAPTSATSQIQKLDSVPPME